MAFKMKGASLYKNGASLKVQKDYAGQADGRATSSPLQQRLTKGGEGQDENKIFDNKGKHVGNYVNGKKVMLKTGKENAAELTEKLAMNAVRKKIKPKNE